MENVLFETSKKASKRKKVPKRSEGWALRFLRFLFNLALILIAVTFTVISGLYAYVTYVYGNQLGRTTRTSPRTPPSTM